ncbi:MAG: pyridoxamine 5'-phosphate oxidase family protein [Bacilli bacterium]|nr:pyridoxamine 5'-phosphate oxidase family protein [Bacilli bacterium]
MRRKDREVTDSKRIEDIIRRCSCCRIGFYDEGEIYIVPLNFGYELKNNAYVFYFHGAKEGRKIDLIQKSPKVGFEMDNDGIVCAPNDAEAACSYTNRFQSIIGNGIVSIVSDTEEKKMGLTLIMEHNAGKREWQFDDRMVDAVTVFKLEVTKISCKEN